MNATLTYEQKYDAWFNNQLNAIGDWTWSPNHVDAILTNANDNATVQLEQMIDFAAKIGIEHLGEGNMKAIYEAGYTTITDFVKMTVVELSQAIGSSVMAKKIHKSKVEKLTNAPWYLVAGAHPCFGRGVGVRKAKKLYEGFSGDIAKLANISQIVSVEGFDIKTATKIASGYAVFMQFVQDCNIVFANYEAPKGGDLSGQSFLFTGFRSGDLEKQIVDRGGKIASSVSSKLTYLVALNPDENSGKLDKAREIGTKIITRDQLIEMLL